MVVKFNYVELKISLVVDRTRKCQTNIWAFKNWSFIFVNKLSNV